MPDAYVMQKPWPGEEPRRVRFEKIDRGEVHVIIEVLDRHGGSESARVTVSMDDLLSTMASLAETDAG